MLPLTQRLRLKRFIGAKKVGQNEVMEDCSDEYGNSILQWPSASLRRIKGVERDIEAHLNLPLSMLHQMPEDLMGVLLKIDAGTISTQGNPISCEWPAYFGSDTDNDSQRNQFRIIIVDQSVAVQRDNVLDVDGKQIAECDFDETTVVLTNTMVPLASTEVFTPVQTPPRSQQNKRTLTINRDPVMETMKAVDEDSLMRLWDTEFYANSQKFRWKNTNALWLSDDQALDMGLLPNVRMLVPFDVAMTALASDEIPILQEAISFLEDVLTPHDSPVNRIAIHCLLIVPALVILSKTLTPLAESCSEAGDREDVEQCQRRAAAALLQRLLDANADHMQNHTREISEMTMKIEWSPLQMPIIDWSDASQENLSLRGLFRETRIPATISTDADHNDRIREHHDSSCSPSNNTNCLNQLTSCRRQ